MMPPSDIIFRFVPMGTVAPSALPPGEFWLDVGHRATDRVFDHHGKDTPAWSAAQLVFNNAHQIRKELHRGPASITLVTHQVPDLDAVSAVWLACKIIAGDPIEAERAWIEPIVEAVSFNDQGMVRTSQPDRCWPIVMRLMLAVEYAQYSDQDRLKAGIQLMGDTFGLVKGGKSLSEAAQELISSTVTKAIAQAEAAYRKDRAHGMTFQVKLPRRKIDEFALKANCVQFEKASPPPIQSTLTDALFLENPLSVLFKELARGDFEQSTLGQGFQLLIVAIRIPEIEDASPYQFRYVISTDPFSGKHLKGLGELLTSLEREKQCQIGVMMREDCEQESYSKRQDVRKVQALWYDGSGHNYTIIDSPVLKIGGKDRCASCLTFVEVLSAIYRFGEN